MGRRIRPQVLLTRMWHGCARRIHPGTECRLQGLPNSWTAHEGERCTVLRFDADRKTWRVTLLRHQGKVLRVPETNLRLCFSIQTQHATTEAALRRTELKIIESSEGSGRGLQCEQPCARGTELFREAPYLITPVGCTDMWVERWRAYVTLMQGAMAGDAEMARAKHTFGVLPSPYPTSRFLR